MVIKLTTQLGSMQQSNSVGVEESEDSMKSVFGVVSNLFTNEVKNVENDNGNEGKGFNILFSCCWVVKVSSLGTKEFDFQNVLSKPWLLLVVNHFSFDNLGQLLENDTLKDFREYWQNADWPVLRDFGFRFRADSTRLPFSWVISQVISYGFDELRWYIVVASWTVGSKIFDSFHHIVVGDFP